MMISRLCKSLISESLKNPYTHSLKSHVSFRLYVFFYSSSKEKLTKSSNAVFDLLSKHGFSSQIASKAASKLSHLKETEKCETIVSFLKKNGFSVAHLEKLLKSKPAVLASDLDKTIEPKVKIFKDLGFSPTDIADILSADPWIFFRSAVNRIEPSIMVLRKLLGSISEVAKALKVSGRYLKYNLETTMLPNIELMKSCGIPPEQILLCIYSFPTFFLHKPENMKKFVDKVNEMGCNRSSKMFIYAIRTLSSMSDQSWELKLNVFRNLGLSEEEILSIFQRMPHVFAVSRRKIKDVIQVLVDTGKYDVSYIFDSPDVLICSVENRLKPRLKVIEILENRNLIKQRPSLTTIYKASNKTFYDKFISPYLDKVDELSLEGTWTKEIHKFANMACLDKDEKSVL